MPRRVQAAEADGADEVEEERELRELQRMLTSGPSSKRATPGRHADIS